MLKNKMNKYKYIVGNIKENYGWGCKNADYTSPEEYDPH